jgi:hypothetical protein
MTLDHGLIVVDGYVPTTANDMNLRDEAWSLALDQRAFGPRKLLVAFADADGWFRGLAYTDRTDPPDLGLEACVDFLGRGARAAVAFCDEEVVAGPIDRHELGRRFDVASEVCAGAGVHLVDWIACDDDQFRSFRFALDDGEWWNVPVVRPPAGPSPSSGRVTPVGTQPSRRSGPRRRRAGRRR